MKIRATIVLMVALGTACTSCAETARLATETFVTNKIADALHFAADFTTNNAVLVNTIGEVAPTTGDYAAVSNAAMHAVQWYDGEEGRLVVDSLVVHDSVEITQINMGSMGYSTIYNGWSISFSSPDAYPAYYFPWSEEVGGSPPSPAQIVATRGDIESAIARYVPTNRTVNGNALTADILLDAADVGALPNDATLAGIANFSNAVLAVGLNIDTNTVAAINALVEAGDELPIGGAATVGGLLLALAAAVAALKRGKADATALRYDIGTETAITSASQEEVEGVTVNYGTATLADRTANRVAITAALDELRLAFPAADSGKVRDFELRVEVGTGSAALTAPALVPVAPTGETVTLENPDGAIPALADGAADAKGVTLLYFSETAPGVFLAKGEQVKEA